MREEEQRQIGHERAVGDSFVEWYNVQQDRHLVFLSKRERPDLVYQDKSDGAIIGLEVTMAYPNKRIAEFEWDFARGKRKAATIDSFDAERDSFCFINPDEMLAKDINKRLIEKCKAIPTYDFTNPIILVINVLASTVSDKTDFECNILPEVELPECVSCCGVYLRISLDPECHFYKLYSEE